MLVNSTSNGYPDAFLPIVVGAGGVALSVVCYGLGVCTVLILLRCSLRKPPPEEAVVPGMLGEKAEKESKGAEMGPGGGGALAQGDTPTYEDILPLQRMQYYKASIQLEENMAYGTAH